jgi:hypothetical protein
MSLSDEHQKKFTEACLSNPLVYAASKIYSSENDCLKACVGLLAERVEELTQECIKLSTRQIPCMLLKKRNEARNG